MKESITMRKQTVKEIAPIEVAPIEVAPIIDSSFFSEASLKEAIELKEKESVALAAMKAAKSSKKALSGSVIHASLYRQGQRTATSIIEIALCVAARTTSKVSPEQIEKFIAQYLKRNDVTHRGEKSTSERTFNHCKTWGERKSPYYGIDEKGLIKFSPLMIEKCKSETFMKYIDELIKNLKA